ncbi:MAG: Hsp20/alpha crystallin family protein [Candidatus Odinarchaeia archaeon]
MRRTIFDEIRKMREAIDRALATWGERFVIPEVEESLVPASIWEPPIDIKETDEEIIVKADMPGVSKENIDLKVSEDILEVKGEAKKEEEEKREGYIRKERSYEAFYKRIRLPSKVVPEKAEAEYKDGVLTVKLPKAESKKAVKISVK